MFRTCTALACLLATPFVSSADPSTPKLHPVNEVCITYEMSGQMMNGTTTRCHRDHGYEMYELEDMKIGIGGFGQRQKAHRITIGDTIYALDLKTNRATKTKNPMYDQIAGALERDGAEQVSSQFMTAMGYSPTGQTKTIAGQTCEVHSSQFVGSACLTSDLLSLEQDVMGNRMTAQSVSYSPGEASNYSLPDGVSVQDGPDLSNGIPGMDGMSLGDLLGQQQ